MINPSKLNQFDRYIHKDGLIIWYEKGTDEIVGTLSLNMDQGQMWISSLYVSPLYRGKGICRSMLDYAVFNGGNYLRVRKGNPALWIYKKYGFKIFDETNEYYYMRLNVGDWDEQS